MFLDLHEIIEMPGGHVPFACELDRDRLSFPALVCFEGPVSAEGEVRNSAGVLRMSAQIRAQMTVLCDRCGKEFDKSIAIPAEAVLKADAGEDDPADLYPLDGDGIDISDVTENCFILDMDTKFLCREDCLGLCPHCGKDLNEGPCGCSKTIDPRMAVLGQLLDDDIQEV